MPANKTPRALRRPSRQRQEGTAAIEFALLAGVFFTLVFGIIEVARLMYVYGTLQEVTRRAAVGAANVYARDAAALQNVRQHAVFRDSPGELVLAAPVTDANIRIEYFALTRDPASNELSLAKIDDSALPSCAAQNRQICMRDPNASNCIRFVQASVCDTANTASCDAVTSTMLLPLVGLGVKLHKATTITPAESLGYTAGMSPCP
jgi:Flp pilus assembly protein TadG